MASDRMTRSCDTNAIAYRIYAPHVLDALDGGGADVGGELLVAEDGESLLEGELEPVPACHAVARPGWWGWWEGVGGVKRGGSL